jgi:prevent-host-death family protein
MKLSNQIKPISYLKANAAEIIRNIGETGNPLIITQNGEGKAVLIDIKEYDEITETLALVQILAMADEDIEEGRCVPIEEAFAQIGVDDLVSV